MKASIGFHTLISINTLVLGPLGINKWEIMHTYICSFSHKSYKLQKTVLLLSNKRRIDKLYTRISTLAPKIHFNKLCLLLIWGVYYPFNVWAMTLRPYESFSSTWRQFRWRKAAPWWRLYSYPLAGYVPLWQDVFTFGRRGYLQCGI